jgi:hypothetical protein
MSALFGLFYNLLDLLFLVAPLFSWVNWLKRNTFHGFDYLDAFLLLCKSDNHLKKRVIHGALDLQQLEYHQKLRSDVLLLCRLLHCHSQQQDHWCSSSIILQQLVLKRNQYPLAF